MKVSKVTISGEDLENQIEDKLKDVEFDTREELDQAVEELAVKYIPPLIISITDENEEILEALSQQLKDLLNEED